uniref:Protein HLJ1 n=1 Tax=Noccaea caerulescens TaxID=107243 RepID=A0A1J3GT12_NOCCA
MSNKDEALRAKDLAEDWMRKSNFSTARRVAAKAQKMDETLENIAHMIMVCDVHCAALEKSGDEMDWYKILQVDQNADDTTIKKQYRMLALHLHPDKNKLPGSESAFKTIGEAQRVLLDKEKRRLHDMRRKPFRKPAPAPAPSFQHQQAPTTAYYTQPVFKPNVNATRNSFTTGLYANQTQPSFQTNVNAARNSFTTGLRPESQQTPQAQPTDFGGGPSFWTSCAFCHMKNEYLREYMNKLMSCPRCGKQYLAVQSAFQGPPVQATFSFFQHKEVPTQAASKAAEKQPENSSRVSPRKEGSRAKSSGAAVEKNNGKRKRKNRVESSNSSSSKSSFEWEEVSAVGQHSRRSVRSKQQVSYNENLNDNDKKEEVGEIAEESDLRKKSHENHLFAETLPNGKVKEDQVGSSRGSGACNAVEEISSESESDVEILECADPDFSNFEKSREERCFKVGQTWARYDKDQMPRYYAVIRKVLKKPRFMLKITWLEAKPNDEKTKQWIGRNLPISVGKYQLGGEEKTNEIPSFSHLIDCRVRGMKDTVSVYPRKGETWALFKNWDINWSSSHKSEFEYVVVLSEYAEGVAIEVAFLRKVKGFASVFCRIAPVGGSDTVQIPPQELLRFSHRIPSTKLTGKEGNGVPVGSYELDTAAIPQKIEEEEEEEVAIPVSREAAKSNKVHHRSPASSEPDCVLIPNFQFHDFSAERLEGKFALGQIWSLNSKEDGLPKNYAVIQQIEWKPEFKLRITRLELKSLPENVTRWRDKKMPVSCGKFILKEGPVEALTHVTGFSHEIKAQHPSMKKNKFTILPKTGEIWAMYKNWSETMKVGSLKKWEYEVVEVLDENESHIEVLVLEWVPEFISVFKEKVEGGVDVKHKIPRCELLRFSHYVPAFRLTGEREGALRGFVELDPTALPRNLLRS